MVSGLCNAENFKHFGKTILRAYHRHHMFAAVKFDSRMTCGVLQRLVESLASLCFVVEVFICCDLAREVMFAMNFEQNVIVSKYM